MDPILAAFKRSSALSFKARPLGDEVRGKLQIQILCGVDDNPTKTHKYCTFKRAVPLV
jgi:hypothetical protein